MTAEEFNAQLGLCQFLPGPNVVNLAVLVGKRQCGLAGAVVAPLGLLGGPMLIVLILGWLYDLYDTDWVIHTRSEERPPAKIGLQARVVKSQISNGCNVRGLVVHSVLSPGVYVSPGAV